MTCRSAPVASLLRGFSAPVRLDYEASEADLIALIARDSDSFNRWQAAQTYASRLLLRSVASIRAGGEPRSDQASSTPRDRRARTRRRSGFRGADDHACRARPISRAISAQTSIPTRSTRRARPCARDRRGPRAPTLLRRSMAPAETGPYSPDAAAAGRRALRNAALDLFCAGNPRGRALAVRQFEAAET